MPERHSDADHSSPTAAPSAASSNVEGSPRHTDATLPETADRTPLPESPSLADSWPAGPPAAGSSTAGPETAGLSAEDRLAGGAAFDSSGSDGFASSALTLDGSDDAGPPAGGVRSEITADAVLRRANSADPLVPSEEVQSGTLATSAWGQPADAAAAGNGASRRREVPQQKAQQWEGQQQDAEQRDDHDRDAQQRDDHDQDARQREAPPRSADGGLAERAEGTSRQREGGVGTTEQDVQDEFEDQDQELALPYWLTSTEEAANTTFARMLRRLPALLKAAWLLAWQAGRGTTVAVVAFAVTAGVASAVGMISVVGVFDGLLRDGPTPERVRAAVPSLILLVVAAAVKGALTSAAAAANGRLSPKVYQAAEMRLLGLTTMVDLSTFDDPEWRDAMERARDRGIAAAQQLVDRAIELGTSMIGLVAAAGVLTVLHPVLLPLLVLSVLPIAWAAVRSARLGHRRLLRLIAVWRRQRMFAELLAAREPAAELRAFTVRSFLLREIRRLLAIQTREEI